MENTVLTWVEWVLIVVVMLDVVVRLYKTFTKQTKENDKSESYSEQNNSKSDESNSEVHIDVDEKGNMNFHTRSLVLQALNDLNCLNIKTNEKTNFVMFFYRGANFVLDVRDDRRVAYIIYPSFMELEANEQNRFLLHEAINEFNGRPGIISTFFMEEDGKIRVSGKTHVMQFYDFNDFKGYFAETLKMCIWHHSDFLKYFNDLKSKASNTNS